MEITVTWIFGLISTIAMAFLGWSLKELYKKHDTDFTKVQKKVDTLEAKLPEKYVLKEDFYREINKIEMKIDSLRENISELNKNVSSLIAKIERWNSN